MAWFLPLAVPITCVAWTVTHEDVFREPREYGVRRIGEARRLVESRFFNRFTCEYCFSHYATAGRLARTGYRPLLDDRRGVAIAFSALVWIASPSRILFARRRLRIKVKGLEAKELEQAVEGNGRTVAHRTHARGVSA